jgi:hypothetical protein
MPTAPEPSDLVRIEALIDRWAAEQLAENPAVDAVERDDTSGELRWFVRVLGEEKSVFSVWFHLRQRNLHVETYLMPAPEENLAEVFEQLLRRNRRLSPFAFAIGDEDAIFLISEIPNESVTDDELDRLLGSSYAFVEQCFRPALRLGFASRLAAG